MNQFLPTLFLFLSFSASNAQSFADRLTLYAGIGVTATDQKEPATLSLAYHPNYQINHFLSFGIRYEYNALQFGSLNKGNNGNFSYTKRDSYLKGMSTFSFIPNFHFWFLGANVSIGMGALHVRRPEVLIRTVSIDDEDLINMYDVNFRHSWGLSMMASATYNRFQTGVILNRVKNSRVFRNTNDYLSLYLNYRILGEGFKHKKNRNIQHEHIPIFSIEGGVQALSNLGRYAGSFNVYLQTSLAVAKNISVGFRANGNTPTAIGFDKDPDTYYLINLIEGENTNLPSLAKQQNNGKGLFPVVCWRTIFLIIKITGRYFITGGGGQYNRGKNKCDRSL